MMYYLFPFQDRISVEFRRYVDSGVPATRLGWTIRNVAWKTLAPASGMLIRRFVAARSVRDLLWNGVGHSSRAVLSVVRAADSYPADQMIRYPEAAGRSRYTFSIWAFLEERFVPVLRAYCAFCRDHYREFGYRCDMLNVGYRISGDRNPLFSYSYDGTVMTVDPVSTAGPGWSEFLDAYNVFCSDHGGSPLLNQTGRLTPGQVAKAYGFRVATFRAYQGQYDPDNRFVNHYFAELLGLQTAARLPSGV